MSLITSNNDTCLNCSAATTGNYCANCGQQTTQKRITLKDTIREFFSTAFSIEGPFWFSVKSLITNPGEVFRSYFAGKRKVYYKPVAFFVLATAVYIIIRSVIGFDPLEGQAAFDISNQHSTQDKTSREAARFMVSNINYILIFLVFAMAMLLKVFFYKKYNFAEYACVGFYIAGMYILLSIPFMFLIKYGDINIGSRQLLLLPMITFYYAASLFQSFSFSSLVKYFLVSFWGAFVYPTWFWVFIFGGFDILVKEIK